MPHLWVPRAGRCRPVPLRFALCGLRERNVASANLNFSRQLPRGGYGCGVPWPKHRELSSAAEAKQQTMNLGGIPVSPLRSFHKPTEPSGSGAALDVPAPCCCLPGPSACTKSTRTLPLASEVTHRGVPQAAAPSLPSHYRSSRELSKLWPAGEVPAAARRPCTALAGGRALPRSVGAG